MDKIKFVCEHCNHSMDIEITKEMPHGTVAGWCNYCPKCEDEMGDYYDEWFVDENDNVLELC